MRELDFAPLTFTGPLDMDGAAKGIRIGHAQRPLGSVDFDAGQLVRPYIEASNDGSYCAACKIHHASHMGGCIHRNFRTMLRLASNNTFGKADLRSEERRVGKE